MRGWYKPSPLRKPCIVYHLISMHAHKNHLLVIWNLIILAFRISHRTAFDTLSAYHDPKKQGILRLNGQQWDDRMFLRCQVLDVGGQQGERRKWITLFDEVTAVLFMMDASSFDQNLREDSHTNRLLESLKVFYQTITTRYVSSGEVLQITAFAEL